VWRQCAGMSVIGKHSLNPQPHLVSFGHLVATGEQVSLGGLKRRLIL
jgi:hypothetical protein